MIKKDCTYKVFDKDGSCWGVVALKWDKVTPLGSHDYFGYLDASKGYEKVSLLFERHDELMSTGGGTEEEAKNSSLAIANLGVQLESDSGEAPIRVLAFVGKTEKGLLFTCSEKSEELR